MSKIIDSCDNWSGLRDFLEKYLSLIEKESDNKIRLFGYASLITDHKNEKGDCTIPNENATLAGSMVAMNVLAVGPKEYRGTYSTLDPQLDPKQAAEAPDFIRNIGCYAGLQSSNNEKDIAKGVNITMNADANGMNGLMWYLKREFGSPPALTAEEKAQLQNETRTIADIFDRSKIKMFRSLFGKPENEFGLYKMLMVETQSLNPETGRMEPKLALTVATNEKSRFAQIYRTDSPEELQADIVQSAIRICDGQGITRKNGDSFRGGKAMDYFYTHVHGLYERIGIDAPIIDGIHNEIEKYLEFNYKINELFKESKNSLDADVRNGLGSKINDIAIEYGYTKTLPIKNQAGEILKGKKGEIFTESPYRSPYFGAAAQMTERDDIITAEDFRLSDMPKTGLQKIERLAKLYEEKLLGQSADRPKD